MKFIFGFTALVIALIWLTGGTIFRVGSIEVNAASLDFWIWLTLGLVAVFRPRQLPWSKLAFQALTHPRAGPVLLIWVFGICFLAHLARHLSFGTFVWDFLPIHQGLFHAFASAARPLACDICLNSSALGEHLSFSFYLLSPFFIFYKSDALVFLIQALLLGGSLWLAISCGPLRKRRGLFGIVALIFLSQRALRAGALWDMREDVLAFAALLACLVGMHRKWPFLYWCGLAIALISKENVFLVTAAMGMAQLLDSDTSSGRKSTAQLTIMISLAYGAWAFRFGIPAFSGANENSHPIMQRYSGLGSTPQDILLTFFSKPWMVLQLFFPGDGLDTLKRLRYVAYLLVPCAAMIVLAKKHAPLGAAKRALIWLIPALPGFAMNLSSSNAAQTSLQFHYDLIVLPFIYWAGLLTLSSSGLVDARKWIAPLALALGFSGKWPGFYLTHNLPTAAQVRAAIFLDHLELPNAQDRVAADGFVLSHLAHLPRLALLYEDPPKEKPHRGTPWTDATHFVIDTSIDWQVRWLEKSRKLFPRLREIARSEHLVVLSRN